MNEPIQATGYDWLSSGGAYYIVGFGWLLSAIFFTVAANLAGKAAGSENDGCLLMICNLLLAIVGGGVGLLIGLQTVGYPNYIVASLLGTILAPAIASAFLVRRMRRR